MRSTIAAKPSPFLMGGECPPWNHGEIEPETPIGIASTARESEADSNFTLMDSQG
jgi:hypothetical protein